MSEGVFEQANDGGGAVVHQLLGASTGTTTLVLVVLLILVGLAMVGVALWLIRVTRADPVALGPLEVMGERGWRRADPDRRASTLSDARPAGAPASPAPMVEYDAEASPPETSDGDADTDAADDSCQPADSDRS